MQKLPIADPKEPRIEMAPEEPFSTALNENTSLGLDFEKTVKKSKQFPCSTIIEIKRTTVE